MTRKDQLSQRVDDDLADGDQAIHAGPATQRERVRDPEMPIEDEPGGSTAMSPLRGGTPEHMTPDDVEGRFRLARFLPAGSFPLTGLQARAMLIRAHAPDAIIAELTRLPEGEYSSVTHIWKALGHGVETP